MRQLNPIKPFPTQRQRIIHPEVIDKRFMPQSLFPISIRVEESSHNQSGTRKWLRLSEGRPGTCLSDAIARANIA
jgi:hypothetical protein